MKHLFKKKNLKALFCFLPSVLSSTLWRHFNCCKIDFPDTKMSGGWQEIAWIFTITRAQMINPTLANVIGNNAGPGAERYSRSWHWRYSLSEANMEGYIHHKLLAIRGFNTTTKKSMRREYQLTTQWTGLWWLGYPPRGSRICPNSRGYLKPLNMDS